MDNFTELKPQAVLKYFFEICQIPHGSRNTDKIAAYLVDFAKKHRLRYLRDEANNVVIFKPACGEDSSKEPVILQGHIDMVCQTAPDCTKDMEREGLDLCVKDGCLYAAGTTLGGDDGVAVAMMLALLESSDLPHPPLECVFTADEEIGMLGAMALDISCLRGRRMVNLDSETEGVFTVSCAGGVVVTGTLPVHREKFSGSALHIRISGLAGGHSGEEIHRGRANADILLGRVLDVIPGKIRLVSVSGGEKDNAIAAGSEAVVVCADEESVFNACKRMEDIFRAEYHAADPEITVEAEKIQISALPMDDASTKRIISLLLLAPNGVQEMSMDIPGLVETSLNLGILCTEENTVSATFCVRSSVESRKEAVVQKLKTLIALLGGITQESGDYPGWTYREKSPLRETMTDVFAAQYGYAPKVEAIHAGLECGLFAGRLPELDCVSIGPDIPDIHTYRERLPLASLERTWNFLLAVLGKLGQDSTMRQE